MTIHAIWTLERIKNPQIGRSHVRSRTTPVYASVSVGGAVDSLLHSLSGEVESGHTPTITGRGAIEMSGPSAVAMMDQYHWLNFISSTTCHIIQAICSFNGLHGQSFLAGATFYLLAGQRNTQGSSTRPEK